jgi:hypothetical protein
MILAIGGVATTAVAAATPRSRGAVDESAVTGSRVQDSVRFRSSVGLPTDLDAVQAALLDPQADLTYGVPLSQREASGIRRRIAVGRLADKADVVARRLPGYAGTYIDQSAGGIPTFLFTKDADAIRGALAPFFAQGDDFVIRTVERSYQDLLGLQAHLWEDHAALKAAGIGVIVTGLRPSANAVTVGIVSMTDALCRGGHAILQAQRLHDRPRRPRDVGGELDRRCWSRLHQQYA